MRLCLLFACAVLIQTSFLPRNCLAKDFGDSKPIYIYPLVGIANPTLSDINNYIGSSESILNTAIADEVSWNTFGIVPQFGLELGWIASRNSCLGLRFTYQQQTLNNDYSNSTTHMSYRPKYYLIDFSANARFLFNRFPSIYIGIHAGYARGSFQEELTFQDIVDPNQDFGYASDYSGSGFSAGAFTGYQFPVGNSSFATIDIGYSIRNLGSFEGYTYSSIDGKYNGPALDNSGNILDFDFSGFSGKVGWILIFDQ